MVGGDFFMSKIIVAAISSIIVFLFNDIDLRFKYLITVIILDIITGLFKAFIKKEINSSISFKGILKKFSYFIILTISVIIGNILGINNVLRNIVIYSLILNEIISILENFTAIGIKIPKALMTSLTVFSSQIEEESNLLEKEKEPTKEQTERAMKLINSCKRELLKYAKKGHISVVDKLKEPTFIAINKYGEIIRDSCEEENLLNQTTPTDTMTEENIVAQANYILYHKNIIKSKKVNKR